MALQAKIEDDLKAAIRQAQELTKSTLRLLLTEIKLESVSKSRPLNDEEVVAVVRKQVQVRQEEISNARQAGRDDLIANSEAEILVLERYLPPPFPKEELEKLAAEAIAEVGATSPAESGQVMKVLMPRLKGQVPGGEAHQVVRELLMKDE
ncbi:MAG: GatB/YqeY domain-containing protein [Anaerolineales bacterium]|nr:GatB/YqeY domain-containing protein [Anaerolineales bacterium]